MALKIFLLSLFVISGFFIIDVNAQNKNTFIIDGYTITTFSDHITDLSLNWNFDDDSSSKIIFDKSMNETISLQIPKSMPRTTNLDFGHFSLHAIQTDGSWKEIKETESQCFYILEIPVNNSDYIEIESVSVAAGRWESVSILDQSCGDFSLKQQLENNMTLDEIECRNEKHILVERIRDQLACVYPTTAEKLGWKIINSRT